MNEVLPSCKLDPLRYYWRENKDVMFLKIKMNGDKNPFLDQEISLHVFIYLQRGSDNNMSGIQVVKSRPVDKCFGIQITFE